MIRNLRSSLGIIEHSCESIHLKGALDRIAGIRPRLALARKTINPVALAHELRVLRESIEDDLKHRHFLYLHKWDYWHNPRWFGDAVYDRFWDAREDMAAATDCYATDNSTATVFHSMRVVEHGMRFLARILKIRKVKNTVPIEYADWGNILKELRAKLEHVRSHGPKGPKKEKLLQFYSAAIDQCEYFNNEWRVPVSHIRGKYSEPDARAALIRARDFMNMLIQVPRKEKKA